MNNLLENFMFVNNDNRYLSPFACHSSESRAESIKMIHLFLVDLNIKEIGIELFTLKLLED